MLSPSSIVSLPESIRVEYAAEILFCLKFWKDIIVWWPCVHSFPFLAFNKGEACLILYRAILLRAFPLDRKTIVALVEAHKRLAKELSTCMGIIRFFASLKIVFIDVLLFYLLPCIKINRAVTIQSILGYLFTKLFSKLLHKH